jgi:hypothetical protein
MSAFETTYNIIGLSAHAPSDEELEAGAEPLVTVNITPGLMLPMENPQAPGQPIVVPLGQIRYRINGEACIEFGETLINEGQRMPKRSKVDIVSSMAGVDEVADRLARLKAA